MWGGGICQIFCSSLGIEDEWGWPLLVRAPEFDVGSTQRVQHGAVSAREMCPGEEWEDRREVSNSVSRATRVGYGRNQKTFWRGTTTLTLPWWSTQAAGQCELSMSILLRSKDGQRKETRLRRGSNTRSRISRPARETNPVPMRPTWRLTVRMRVTSKIQIFPQIYMLWYYYNFVQYIHEYPHLREKT